MASSSRCTHWQLEMDSVLQRDLYLLEHEEWADCVFVVGAEGRTKEFRCHRVFLAKTSPVMAAMLYGGLRDEGGVNRVSDLEPEAFEALLRYIYSGSLVLEDLDTAFGLLHAAKKYLLPDSLQRAVRVHIREGMFPGSVWTALDFARENDEQEMLREAMDLVQQNTALLLTSPDLLEVSSATLTAVVREEGLDCSEQDVYEACLRWARSEAAREGLGEGPEALRQVLGPALRHVRFLAMTPQQFAQGPAKDKLLTDLQCLRIFARMSDPQSQDCPEDICPIARPRKEAKEVTKVDVSDEGTFVANVLSPDELQRLIRAGDVDLKRNLETQAKTEVVAPRFTRHRVYSIRVPSQVKPRGCDLESYPEDLTVLIYSPDQNKLICQERYTKTVRYDSLIKVPCRTILVEGSISYTVAFHTPGRYPCRYTGPGSDAALARQRGRLNNLCYNGDTWNQNDFKYIHSLF